MCFVVCFVVRLEASPHPSQLGSGPETAMFEQLAHKVRHKFMTSYSSDLLF